MPLVSKEWEKYQVLRNFWNWLWGKEVYIIEVDEKFDPRKDDEESIRALAHHPGFVALMNRLKLQRGVLKTRLENQVFDDIRQCYHLQNGLKWLDYLNSEVNKVVLKKQEAQATRARPDEQAEFNKVFALFESV